MKELEGDELEKTREKVILILSKILLDFGQKNYKKYIATPYITDGFFVNSQINFFRSILEVVGLDIRIKDEGYQLSFIHKYPLYVYAKLSETVLTQIDSER